VAQLFSLGHETVLDFTLLVWLAKIRAVRVEMRRHSAVRLGLARAGSHGEQVRQLVIDERWDLPDFIEL
jgi:hypothetical protein